MHTYRHIPDKLTKVNFYIPLFQTKTEVRWLCLSLAKSIVLDSDYFQSPSPFRSWAKYERPMAKFLYISWLVEMQLTFFYQYSEVFRKVGTVDGAVFCLGLKDCHKLSPPLRAKHDFLFQTDPSKTKCLQPIYTDGNNLNPMIHKPFSGVCGSFPLDISPQTITVFLTVFTFFTLNRNTFTFPPRHSWDK